MLEEFVVIRRKTGNPRVVYGFLLSASGNFFTIPRILQKPVLIKIDDPFRGHFRELVRENSS